MMQGLLGPGGIKGSKGGGQGGRELMSTFGKSSRAHEWNKWMLSRMKNEPVSCSLQLRMRHHTTTHGWTDAGCTTALLSPQLEQGDSFPKEGK